MLDDLISICKSNDCDFRDYLFSSNEISYLFGEWIDYDRILNVDCGRGELSYILSQSGARVTGIDYSSSAIQIAKATYLNNSTVTNLEFIQDDFLNHKFNNKFNKIIATDFVEHIEEDKLELMIQKIKYVLKEKGLFIVIFFFINYFISMLTRKKGK